MPSDEPLMRFGKFLKKHDIKTRTGHNWKGTVFPVYQIGRVIMVRESEALAALERFRLNPRGAR